MLNYSLKDLIGAVRDNPKTIQSWLLDQKRLDAIHNPLAKTVNLTKSTVVLRSRSSQHVNKLAQVLDRLDKTHAQVMTHQLKRLRARENTPDIETQIVKRYTKRSQSRSQHMVVHNKSQLQLGELLGKSSGHQQALRCSQEVRISQIQERVRNISGWFGAGEGPSAAAYIQSERDLAGTLFNMGDHCERLYKLPSIKFEMRSRTMQRYLDVGRSLQTRLKQE